MPGMLMSITATSKRSPASTIVDGRVTAGRLGHVHLPALQLEAQDPAVGGVVVHDERERPARVASGAAPGVVAGLRAATEANGEMEGAAGTVDAVHLEGAAHGLDQSLADRQSEAGATVDPGGRASTWLNESNRLARRSAGMPMPVSATAKRSDTFPSPRSAGCSWGSTVRTTSPWAVNLTALREQVDQHLAQPGDVTDDVDRAALIDVADEFESFGWSTWPPPGRGRPRRRPADRRAAAPTPSPPPRSWRNRGCR